MGESNTSIMPPTPSELALVPPLDITGEVDNPTSISTDPTSTQVEQLGQIAKNFRWKDHLLDPSRINAQMQEFYQRTQFPAQAESLSDAVADSFAFTNQVYQTIFADTSCPLPYHDLVHAKLTGITALKLFLGGLSLDSNLLETLQTQDQLNSAIQIFLLASTLHEIDDWLTLDGVASPDNFKQAKRAIDQHLNQARLSRTDFDRIILLDSYAKDPQDSLWEAENVNPNQSVFNSPDILSLAQKSIQAADFLQIANPAYYSLSTINIDDKPYTFALSHLALCWEMIKFRPKALVDVWKTDQGHIDIRKLKPDSNFVRNFAFSRIRPGLELLQAFDPNEYVRAGLSLEAVFSLPDQP